MKLFRFAWLAFVLAACAPSAAEAPLVDDQWRSIQIETAPADLGAERAGRLIFRGGLVLTSDDEAFGGFSDLEVMPDGRMLAITDNGMWLSARLRLDDEGKLVGLDEPRLAAMRDEDGDLFPNKESADSEGLAQLPDGRFAVSFEQSQTIRIYDFNRDGPFGAAEPGPRLAEIDRLAPNVGLEALAATEDGDLIVGAENSEGGARLWRAPLRADAPVPVTARYPLALGFSLVDFDRLPSGDLVALERFFVPLLGVRTRIARLPLTSLHNENGLAHKEEWALLEGRTLALDNFEGIAAVAQGENRVRLYIISDDNFSPQQRTLLYAFDLAPE